MAWQLTRWQRQRRKRKQRRSGDGGASRGQAGFRACESGLSSNWCVPSRHGFRLHGFVANSPHRARPDRFIHERAEAVLSLKLTGTRSGAACQVKRRKSRASRSRRTVTLGPTFPDEDSVPESSGSWTATTALTGRNAARCESELHRNDTSVSS